MTEYDDVIIMTQAEYDDVWEKLHGTGMLYEFYPDGIIAIYKGKKVLIDG